jgi:hypothetical protein
MTPPHAQPEHAPRESRPNLRGWPALPLAGFRETYRTLHLWTQSIGKVRLALTPKMNQWWNVPLYLTARGLTTSPIAYEDRTFEIDLDFIDHELSLKASDGRERRLPLMSRPVAEFHRELFEMLEGMQIRVHVWPTSVEMPRAIRIDQDREHGTYDPAQAHRFWQVLRRAAPVLEEFRARFRGKCSPVHFFWGSFDLAVTRFSGRPAPLRGTSPIERDAYDEEVHSVGFWPGEAWNDKDPLDASFYAYALPTPGGFDKARVRPAGALWNARFGEFILPYDDVRRSADPRQSILEFAQSTYEAAAELAYWNRPALEYR